MINNVADGHSVADTACSLCAAGSSLPPLVRFVALDVRRENSGGCGSVNSDLGSVAASRAVSRGGCFFFFWRREADKNDVEVQGCRQLSGAEQVL